MKIIEPSQEGSWFGQKRAICANCFEYVENCIGCEWHKCSVCKKELAEDETYEYRGAYSCAEHFEETIKKRDFQRQEVITEIDASIRSQADGEWNNGGYKSMRTGLDGRPITKVKEPFSLQKYEGKH